jgi:hypothetical protein
MSLFSSSARRTFAAGGAVLLLGGSAVGIASAQTAPAPTPTSVAQRGPQAFVDALAKRLGITSANLQQAIDQARSDVGAPAGGGFGPGGPGGRRGPGGFGADLTAAAQAIGITADQLRQELPGKSLTQVAQAHGKNPADVATALKTAAHTRIDQEVTAGRLTADQAATRKTEIDTRIDQQMSQVGPQAGAAGRGGPGAPGGPRGFGRDLNAAAQALGITADQLRQELPGKSLTQVAQAHSKNPADVATALKTAAHTAIDQQVTDGHLTADQAATRKTQIDARIDQQMTEVVRQRQAAAQ